VVVGGSGGAGCGGGGGGGGCVGGGGIKAGNAPSFAALCVAALVSPPKQSFQREPKSGDSILSN